MGKNIFITIGLVYLFLCLGCRKEHVAPINQLAKDLFCFKTGSEWVYYDSISQTTQRMLISNYEATRLASMPKGRRRAYNWAEYIEMKITIENFGSGTTKLEADEDQDNTLRKGVSYIYTPTEEFLYISCDENTNFVPSPTYLTTYTVNETIYSDVYVFHQDDVSYYVSKHIGFIRCVKNNYLDLVLTDKNVQQ